MSDLRCGDWRDVLADVECDALIVDAPYGEKTHSGHDAGVNGHRGVGFDDAQRNSLSYPFWTPDDVDAFVTHWSPKTRSWMVAMTDHNLLPAWLDSMTAAGRYAFAPVPCLISGMTVRMGGDGPSSWAVYLAVSRPKTRDAARWGTLPGGYYGRRSGGQHIGGKPVWLMSAIVRDYSRPGDLICDPCAGMATTAVAAESFGRRFVGAEIDPATHARAVERLSLPSQADMFT